MNIFPSLFEDFYLKKFSENVQKISEAATIAELDSAVRNAFSSLELVPDAAMRENAKRRLRAMEELARKRIEKF